LNENKNEKISLRLTLEDDDPLYDIFKRIKNDLGLKSNTEVIRFIFKQIAKIPFPQFISEMQEVEVTG
jgi:hypothetical protein